MLENINDGEILLSFPLANVISFLHLHLLSLIAAGLLGAWFGLYLIH